MNHKEILNRLSQAVLVGLREIEEAYRQGDTRLVRGSKTKHAETAIVDLKVGAAVVSRLKELFSFTDDNILVEETAQNEVDLKKKRLVVDPVDSTRAVLHNLPGAGCAIAYLEDGVPLYSCIGQIAATSARTGFFYDLVRGSVRPRLCFSIGESRQHSLRVSRRRKPGDFIVGVETDAFDVSRENFADAFRIAEELMPPLGNARAIRMYGSSSLGFVCVCRGSLDIFVGSRKAWDYLPGIPVLIGAGGYYFFFEDACGVEHVCACANRSSLAYAKNALRRAEMKILRGGAETRTELINTPSG